MITQQVIKQSLVIVSWDASLGHIFCQSWPRSPSPYGDWGFSVLMLCRFLFRVLDCDESSINLAPTIENEVKTTNKAVSVSHVDIQAKYSCVIQRLFLAYICTVWISVKQDRISYIISKLNVKMYVPFPIKREKLHMYMFFSWQVVSLKEISQIRVL